MSTGIDHAVIDGFKRWKDLDGISTRSEFWYWFLFEAILLVMSFIFFGLFTYGGVLFDITFLIILFPGTSVTIRRLHDSGHSGWNILFYFLFFIGWAYLIYLLCLPSVKDSLNQYWDRDRLYKNMKNSSKKTKYNSEASTNNKSVITSTTKESFAKPASTQSVSQNSTKETLPQSVKSESTPQPTEVESKAQPSDAAANQPSCKETDTVISQIYDIAQKGPDHFDLSLTAGGKLELILFDLWYVEQMLSLNSDDFDDDAFIDKMASFVKEQVNKLGINSDSEYDILYYLRNEYWEKEVMGLAKSDFPKTRQYMPIYLYLCFIKKPLHVIDDTNRMKELVSDVPTTELVKFLDAYIKHQHWLVTQYKSIH